MALPMAILRSSDLRSGEWTRGLQVYSRALVVLAAFLVGEEGGGGISDGQN